MSTIVTRAGKGSPLTNTEVDSNFTNLNTDKIQVVGTPTSGQAVVWDAANSRWVPGTAASRVTISSTAPAGATAGDRWLDADTGVEYLYTDDGTSSQWVEFGPTAIVAGGGAIVGVIVPNLQTATVNEELPVGSNGQSIGPITVDTGVTITIGTGSKWVILNY